jgi:hypothetical protein
MATYQKTSPYYTTTSTSAGYLGTMIYRDIPAQSDDILYTIAGQYQYRPDLLAYALYNDSNLWWVFAMRNLSVIKDPIYDFVAGTQIYLPKLSTIKSTLGI